MGGAAAVACGPLPVTIFAHEIILMLRRVQFWKEVVYREGRASTTPVRIMCNTGAAQQKPYKIYRGLLNFEWNFFFNIKLCLTLVFIIYCEEFF